jgi:hypothetical protein
MPRGCDNPNSRFNNQPSAAPWTWRVIDEMGGQPIEWCSDRHLLRVVAIAGYRIASGGKHLRGPNGRVRVFKTAGAAQVAADIEAGVA